MEACNISRAKNKVTYVVTFDNEKDAKSFMNSVAPKY